MKGDGAVWEFKPLHTRAQLVCRLQTQYMFASIKPTCVLLCACACVHVSVSNSRPPTLARSHGRWAGLGLKARCHGDKPAGNISKHSQD